MPVFEPCSLLWVSFAEMSELLDISSIASPEEAGRFRASLKRWAQQISRPMPWKGESDPYRIWLAEIILQQTRVGQGWAYYERFLRSFPTVSDLANAPLDRVMKLWEGLGYYSRARNLHHTAQTIVEKYNGVFPERHADILSLKGIGPYTAAAIASFAFGLPYAVVDGNVYRVLARFWGVDTPIDSTAGKKLFSRLAQRCLDDKQPGAFNQQIIDFGALQCRPRNPDCGLCPLRGNCRAYQSGRVSELPVKQKKKPRRKRLFNYLYIQFGESCFIERREKKDIWRKLYQFPLIETSTLPEWEELEQVARRQAWWKEGDASLQGLSRSYSQSLTHQQIQAVFWKVHLQAPGEALYAEYRQVENLALREFAFPRIINCYLADKSLNLNL